jgi:hypothetical protein
MRRGGRAVYAGIVGVQALDSVDFNPGDGFICV